MTERSTATAPADGRFHRQRSRFRDQVPEAVAGRYHLYVSWACPWAHRTVIVRRLKGLDAAIGVSVVDPIRDDRGWAFTGNAYVDEVNGFHHLSEAYEATDPHFAGRYSVPVLWDKVTGRIVNNESSDIVRMLDTVFDPLATTGVVLCPPELRAEIDALNAEIYEHVNNAVYRAGFATRQEVYEEEVRGLFTALDRLDDRLADRRFLFGPRPLETD